MFCKRSDLQKNFHVLVIKNQSSKSSCAYLLEADDFVLVSALGRISEGELPPEGGRPQDEGRPQQHKEETGHISACKKIIILH